MKKKKLKLKKKNLLIIVCAIVFMIVIIGAFFLLKKDKPVEDKHTNDDKVFKEEKTEVEIIDEHSNSRPLAFMIDNSDDARSLHTGLNKAYLVYEILNYADGRTRFMALYKDSDVEKVGPIRSTRHYHLDYVLENDAIFVHWGQSTIAQSDLKSLGINDINGITYGSDKEQNKIENGRFFWTDSVKDVSISHRRFTSMELMNSAIKKLKYKTDTSVSNLFKYSVDLINNEDGTMANKVELYYSDKNYVTYEYDPNSHSYKRSVKGKAHIDNSNNEQIKVTNIIAYQVKNYTIPNNPDLLQELENLGSGEGYYITNGRAMKIKWAKECRDCQTKYTYLDGSEVILNDGNTFIQIMPVGNKLNIS